MFESHSISATHNVYYSKVSYTGEEELIAFLRSKKVDLTELSSIKNSKRRMEWLSIRKIICEVNPLNDIIYSKDGKPFFNHSSFHLSISHSMEMIAISINQLYNTGIDIQMINPKVKRIQNKFLNKNEIIKLENSTTLLTCYWCIKEALFKIYGKKDAFLKDNIEIDSFHFNGTEGNASGTIRVNKHISKHQLSLKMIDNYILAYTVNS